jgi:ACR3 family arsenite efflux pump ArsB
MMITWREILTGVGLYLAVPLAGVILYRSLCCKILAKQHSCALNIPFFGIFFVYGGWTIIFLTVLFWRWSGMASIGGLLLVFVMPFLMLGQTAWLWSRRMKSIYHLTAFWLSASYLPLVAGLAIAKFTPLFWGK